jgi:hypothetical protein
VRSKELEQGLCHPVGTSANEYAKGRGGWGYRRPSFRL